MEIYGRKNIPKLTELVKELAESKKVSVQVILDSEQPREESYFSDYEGELVWSSLKVLRLDWRKKPAETL